MNVNGVTQQIIGAAIDVHRELGPGLLEATYEACLVHELLARNLEVERQKALPVSYKGITVLSAYRIDILVAGKVIVEVKSVAQLERIHEAQILTYLKLSGCPIGLLINFNVKQVTTGVRRLVNHLAEPVSAISASSAVRL
jgi:GxxExxY protein